jgi:5,10-methylenetetrahydromethanopterin reductase
MKFGIKIGPIRGWIEHVKLAEEQMFDYIWFGADHTYTDSCAALAYAATQTKRIRLAPLANSVYLRHPVYLASATSLIDEFSNGRAVAGLCSAGFEATVRLKIQARESTAMIKETIEIMRELWKGAPLNYAGKFFTLNNVKLTYTTREDIPIYVATRGSKLKLAGEMCDGVFIHGKALNYVRILAREIGDAAVKAGRKAEGIDLGSVIPCKITSDKDEAETAKRSLRPLMAGFVGGEWPMEEWAESQGLSIEELKPIRKAVSEGDFQKARSLIDDRLLDKIVGAYCIIGSVDECLDEVKALENAGVTQVIHMVNSVLPGEEYDKEMTNLLELFGKEIIPRFK